MRDAVDDAARGLRGVEAGDVRHHRHPGAAGALQGAGRGRRGVAQLVGTRLRAGSHARHGNPPGTDSASLRVQHRHRAGTRPHLAGADQAGDLAAQRLVQLGDGAGQLQGLGHGDREQIGLDGGGLRGGGRDPHAGLSILGLPHDGERTIMSDTKIQLPESEIPRHWYNIAADMPNRPQPPLHPGTGEPVGPDDLAPLFPMDIILQEVSTDPEVAVPEEVLDVYRMWRPTPLYRARRLEQALGTGSRIYYKYEGVSPAGSHKPNTAVPQAFYSARAGRKRLATETGAGQWGSSLALACQVFGLECKVYMVRVSYEQKPYRRIMMETWGADVVPSPSPDTNAGRQIREADPDSPGQPGDRHLRGGRGRRDARGHQLLAGLRAEPRADAPDGDRPGGAEAARGGRRGRHRRRHRLRRRRQQLRRPGAALRPRQDRRRRHRDRRLRARRLPDADPRPVRLRLRRHRPADAAGADAHAGPRLRPAGHPRRRPALPRRRADRVPAAAGRADPGGGVHARPRCSRPR